MSDDNLSDTEYPLTQRTPPYRNNYSPLSELTPIFRASPLCSPYTQSQIDANIQNFYQYETTEDITLEKIEKRLEVLEASHHQV